MRNLVLGRTEEPVHGGIFVGREISSLIEMFLATEVVFFFRPQILKADTGKMIRNVENCRCALGFVGYNRVVRISHCICPHKVIFKNMLMTNMGKCGFFFSRKLTYRTVGKCSRISLP